MDESRRGLFVLVVILIIDLISFTCILPLYPSIIDFYATRSRLNGKPDLAYEYFDSFVHYLKSWLGVPDLTRYNNVFFGGIIGSLFSALQYLSSPIIGALSDIYGRKPLLVVSILGSLLSYYLWSIADTFGLFILSRIVGGLSKASVSIAIAIVTDLLPAHSRGKGMAYVGVSFSIAFILGPMIGAYFVASMRTPATTPLTDDDDRGKNVFSSNWTLNSAPAIFAMTMTLVELAMVLALMPETLKYSVVRLREIIRPTYSCLSPKSLFNYEILSIVEGESDKKEQRNAGNERQRQRIERRNLRLIRRYSLVYFLYLLLYSALEFTLCFLTHIRFRYDGTQQGRLYAIVGVFMIVIQGGYVRRIPLERQPKAALYGLAAIIPAYMLISVAFSQSVLYIGLLLYAIASALVVPCITTMVSSHCDENKRGACMGVLRSIGALARACGPVFGSMIFWLMGPTLCYMIGGLLLLIPLVMLRRVIALSDDENAASVEEDTTKVD